MISGIASQGQTLNTSNGTWSGGPTTYAYQWRSCDSSGNNCSDIPGATGPNDQLTSNDVGQTLRAVVTANNSGGSTSATSSQSNVVASQPPTAPSNTGLPTITGTTTQGQTLSASNGTWDGSPTGYNYQWKDCDSSGSNCGNIAGATSSSYPLTSGDVGQTLRAVVTATNAGGATPATSAATGVITQPNAGGSTIVGTAGEPGLACDSTINVGASVQTALAAASPGQTVCLGAGSWAHQTLTRVTPAAPGVTLAAKPGAVVSTGGYHGHRDGRQPDRRGDPVLVGLQPTCRCQQHHG